MRSLTDEDETLLDEGRDGVVGGEEEEADSEDEEAEAVGDALEGIRRILEHCGHHETHDGEDYEPGEEELWGSLNVLEVPAHENPSLGNKWVGEFRTKVVMFHGICGIL